MIKFNKEQRFIVTGASSGIGESIALLLNELGASVIGIGRNQKRLDGLKAKSKMPDNIFIENKDLTQDIEALPNYVKELKERYGKLQGIVCSAGIISIQPLQIVSLKKMQEVFNINYFAPFFMMKGFADRRINNGKGSGAVMISSLARVGCDRGMSEYCGSKAALSSSMKCIAKELINAGVRVNCISPASIDTDMHDMSLKCKPDNSFDVMHYPLGIGEPSDVSNLAVYLLSDKAKWISGQDYIVDTGLCR
jgi:NAD(P)-dependent dehydrogenase (short-subunit alcohol dehydrogenase family)